MNKFFLIRLLYQTHRLNIYRCNFHIIVAVATPTGIATVTTPAGIAAMAAHGKPAAEKLSFARFAEAFGETQALLGIRKYFPRPYGARNTAVKIFWRQV